MMNPQANLSERFAGYTSFAHGQDIISFDMADEERMALVNLPVPLEVVVFVSWLKDMRKQLVVDNQALVIGFEGKPRSGKSASAVTMAYMLDPTFWPNMDKRIVTTAEQLMEQLMLLRQDGIDGGVIIVDESGVTVGSEDYYERWYKELSKMFLIYGYIHPCIFFCSLSRADTGAKFRRKFMQIVMCKRDRNNYTKIKSYDYVENAMFKRFDHKTKKVTIAGRRITIRRIKFGLPPKFIINRYKKFSEPGKDVMMKEFSDNVKFALGPKPEKKSKHNTDYEGVMNSIRLLPNRYESRRSKPDKMTFDAALIKQEFNLTFQDAQGIKRKIEKELSK